MGYKFVVLGEALDLIVVVLIMMRVKVASVWIKLLLVCGVVQSVLRIRHVSLHSRWCMDYRTFRRAGVDLLVGIDPYEPSRWFDHQILHLPTAFPVFTALALLPEQAGPMIWTILNSSIALLIVPLALKVVKQPPQGPEWGEILVLEAGALTMLFALSNACSRAIFTGQLALLVAILILLALYYRGRQPVVAGVFLALATVKVNTMAPFGLLFLRRRDRATWVSCAATILVLLLLSGHPERLFDQGRAMLRYIGMLSQPGMVNNPTYTGLIHESIVGFDHALYRVGIHDPRAYRIGSAIILIAMGGWLARGIWTGALSDGLAVALVSLFSVVFLYHRIYDTVIIGPAVVFAYRQAKSSRGRTRYLSITAFLLMLSVLNIWEFQLRGLFNASWRWGGGGTLVRAAVLPCATWAVLLSMVCLVLADRPSVSTQDVEGR